ncbi:MAG TPA: DMT family transporter [Vicinamibacterales bacterium]|nr:DMT family transporter [Vicinamibacterales bacterium]
MTRIDFALLLMILIWGSNFSIVKVALTDFPEGPFNAMRLIVGTTVYLAVVFGTSARERLQALTRRDWVELFFLGSVGTFLYQFCFVASVKRTSVGNGSLIIGVSPIVIALLSAIVGHERIRPVRWLGIAVAMLGLYLVVGHGVDVTGQTWRGDLLMMGGVLCWAIYSVGSQGILKRHPPLIVISLTFSIGATLYVMVLMPVLIATDWSAVSGFSWAMMVTSALLALNLSYWIWYTGLKKLGGSRTSVYSYLTPVVAMVVAALWLGEPVSGNQVAGAGAILTGLLITRFIS